MSLAGLKRLTRERDLDEHCELCQAPIAEAHRHLFDPSRRDLLCACDSCGLLFSAKADTKYRLVPREIAELNEFRMSDELWNELMVPVNMAFFHYSTPMGKIVAYYPSPAGPTESLLALEAWSELVQDNPVLATLEPDVQALLVNRTGTEHSYYLAPIDECYKLVGLIRSQWRGLSGGTEVWRAITAYFESLNARSSVRA
jgi:uncharacterized protein DUF5947